MVRIMAVANQKGGVGKTTTALNLGAALAERGRRVLLIDLDPQASLTASLGVDPYQVKASTHGLLLEDDSRLGSFLYPLGGDLWLAPAAVELAAAEFRLAQVKDRARRLKAALSRDLAGMEIILIDTPPSLGLLTINALSAASDLLIPVECQYLALRGVRSLLETTRLVHERLHPHLRLLGIVATMLQSESDNNRAVLRELRAVFGDKVFRSVVEYDDAVAMAPAARASILRYKPGSPAAAGYRALADEVLERWGEVQPAPAG